MDDRVFATQIRERFPEGLTGIFSIGGTRTAYILEKTRSSEAPGRIQDFSDHADYVRNRYFQFSEMFFGLGGQNMIITAMSYRVMYKRGEEYASLAAKELVKLINPSAQAFYRANDIDPYFVGIDTFLHYPEGSEAHQAGQQYLQFQADWPRQPQHRKLIWELGMVPIYLFWKATESMTAEERALLNREIAQQSNLIEVNYLLYRHFSRAILGTEIPAPHLYVGSNKSGDLKWSWPMPLGFLGHEYLRMFFTPYPSFFMKKETMKTILEEVAFKERFHSTKTDYAGQYTPDLIEEEYRRVMALSADPQTTIGLLRNVAIHDSP